MKKDIKNLNKFTSNFIVSSRGQLDYPGMNTLIPNANGRITMKGVKQNVLGIDDLGNKKIMKPKKEYQFPGDSVYEIPLNKRGGQFKKGLVNNPKKTKKDLTSKKYSRSLSATNVLFTENSLFKKPKSRKNKVFDPNSKYYAEGGALLTKKVTCKKCGWKWDAEDGGNDITTCHKCGGQGLIHAQKGGNKDAMTGMMKARLAYANEFGNTAAERMINLPDNPYQFDNGDTGSHYMASMDNYAVPQIQDENGVLQLGDYGPESNEAIRFDSDEDANYFAEHYKDVSPGFINEKQYGGENENPFDKVQNLNEVTVYENQEKRKLQGSLIDRLKQVKKAYNDHRVNLGLKKQKQSAEGTSSIISLKDQIQSYKKELDEEKKSYDKASKALNVLKKYNPQSYKKAKVSDVLNATGVDDLRNLYKEGKISDATFMDFYDNFGKSYDREATRTTEEDQVKLEDSWYGKPDEKGRTRWMGNPNNVAKVAQTVAIGAPLAAAAPIMAPAVVSTLANPYVAGGLNAYFGYHGIKEFGNEDSHTRKSMSRAYDDPTGSNIGDAAWDVGINSLNFLGLPFGKAIKGSKNLINNTYKINPWAFKANPEAYYHRSPNLENIVNRETGTLQGFGNSKAGIEFSKDAGPGGTGNLAIRGDGSVSRINLKKPANSQLYFSKGVPLDGGRYNKVLNKKTGKLIDGQGYEGPYMVQVEGVPMGASTKGRAPGADVTNIGGYAVPRRPISLDEAKFYKEHWLQGYKEVPKQLPGSPNKEELVDLWRIQEKNGKTFAQLTEEGKINPLFNNPATLAKKAEEEKYFGQWFTKDKNDFNFYKADREFKNPEIINLKVPKSKLEQYSQYDRSLSRAPDREFVIPLSEQQKYINTSSVDDVVKQPWQIEELPGLHLQSTMEGEAISKIVDKTGKINTEQALAIIAKESGGADKVALIKQGLGETIPKKIDFNEFRKITQEQLIPLEKQFSEQASNYGLGKIGYPLHSKYSYESLIERNKFYIAELKEAIAKNPKVTAQDIDKLSNDREILKLNKNYLLKMEEQFSKLPLENQTLILGNKGKFGTGSSAHGNPEETLGHIHFLRDAQHPDIAIATQIQSDAFQGTHRIMPQIFNKEKELENLVKLENIAKIQEETAKTAKQISDDIFEFPDGLKMDKTTLENIGKTQKEYNAMKKAEIENFTQKSLLDKNHQERYLQEFMDYAGKRGDLNYIAIPKSETAAKAQGYFKTQKNNANKGDIVTLNNGTTGTIFAKSDNAMVIKHSDGTMENIKLEYVDPKDLFGNMTFPIKNVNGKPFEVHRSYSPEQQTILKKYTEYEKMAKKLGWETNNITVKGNEYTKIKIPKKFKEGKGEIKAFSTIGTGVLGLGLGATQYKQGGATNDYVDVDLTPKEVKDLIAQGYVIEALN